MQNVKNNPAKNESVKPVPEGLHTVTPFVIVDGAEKFIQFIKDAFNGELTYVYKGEDSKIVHSTVRIGDSIIMIADSMEEFRPMSCMLQLYVEDVDAQYKQALKAGGQSLREPQDEFYGDRSCGIKDSWGNQWWVATHIEDLSKDEVRRREEEMRKEKV